MEPDRAAPLQPGGRAVRSRWIEPALEAGLAFAGAGLLAMSGLRVEVDPLDRLGQVSGLAALGLSFTLASLALTGALLLVLRWRPRRFELALRASCALVAGLASGFVAGGLSIALRGTPWCLNGDQGDASALAGFADWARGLRYGQPLYPYPPIPVLGLAWYGELTGLPSPFAMKHLEILGTACFGPLAYLSWRLLLRPVWALGIGVLAALPLIDPYKPYANLTLIVFVPLTLRLFQFLRGAGACTMRRILVAGAGFGAGFALLCLGYAAWFRWSAPGLLVATLVFFPWPPAARRKGLVFLAAGAATFAALSGWYVWRALAAALMDDYVYFDARVEPTYFAMWLWDSPGPLSTWPPPGELGGVGLFTVLLAAGWAVAIALGRDRIAVGTLGLLMVSAWVMRFWFAQQLFVTKLVQLYPRTSIQILHCALLLCGYALHGLTERWRAKALRPPGSLARGAVGALCGLCLVLGSAGSSIADRYMPHEPVEGQPSSFGQLAWRAHVLADVPVADVARARRCRLLRLLSDALGQCDFDVRLAAEELTGAWPESRPPDHRLLDLTRRLPHALRDAQDMLLDGLRLVPVRSAPGEAPRWRVERR